MTEAAASHQDPTRPPVAALVARTRALGSNAPPEDLRTPHSATEPVSGDDLAAVRQRHWSRIAPSRLAWATLDDFDGRNHERLADWSTHPAGRNLVLAGPVGVGKSHAALAACRVLHDRGWSVEFVPVVELLDRLRPGGDPSAFEDAIGVDVLIIDDLGSERPTDWTAERLFAVVNRRWLEEHPTVVTTNLAADALEAAIGERMFSRLVGGAVTLRLTGDDRRRSR